MIVPKTQRAVQVVGPDELLINEAKPVFEPGPHQVLGRIEAVGLCYSDLKLLKQFSRHARKSEAKSGIDASALAEMPHYVPGDKPVVPGHETVLRVVKAGPNTRHELGGRFLVQTDYRWLPTAGSNAAFGYTFEGGLQEYVLLDERVITSPEGESMLLPVPEYLSGSAVALVEPWACVEHSYVEQQRRRLKDGGQTLVVGEAPVDQGRVERLPGRPAAVTFVIADELADLENAAYDDVIYFGWNAETVESLFPKLASGGLLDLVQCGGKFGRPVASQVGRVHYGGIRLVGTSGWDPSAAMAAIPATAEIRPHDKINIVGAAGPMGSMHVVRDLCEGVPGVTVFAGDVSDERLALLQRLGEPLARKNGLLLRPYNPSRSKPADQFDYIVVMAPVPALVAEAVPSAAPGAIINVFAGIPAEQTVDLDLDAYVEKRLYLTGSSGSVLDDMRTVLAKLVSGRLDTDLSVAAVSGLDGVIDGIRAVEKNLMPGKIIVYPSCRGLGLTSLTELAGSLPLGRGHWNKAAEEALVGRRA